MASPFLSHIAGLIDTNGITVHRFEFDYMAARTAGAGRRPAPRAETLVDEYRLAIADCRKRVGPAARLFIGGKSMGGRIACLAAGEINDQNFEGVVVLGFPLVPPSKPTASRAGVIEGLAIPTLVIQGTRDAFGGPDAFNRVRLPNCVRLHWIANGDHDLKPRKSSGLTHEETLRDAADAVARFIEAQAR